MQQWDSFVNDNERRTNNALLAALVVYLCGGVAFLLGMSLNMYMPFFLSAFVVVGVVLRTTTERAQDRTERLAVQRWVDATQPSSAQLFAAMRAARLNHNYALRALFKSHLST